MVTNKNLVEDNTYFCSLTPVSKFSASSFPYFGRPAMMIDIDKRYTAYTVCPGSSDPT